MGEFDLLLDVEVCCCLICGILSCPSEWIVVWTECPCLDGVGQLERLHSVVNAVHVRGWMETWRAPGSHESCLSRELGSDLRSGVVPCVLQRAE